MVQVEGDGAGGAKGGGAEGNSSTNNLLDADEESLKRMTSTPLLNSQPQVGVCPCVYYRLVGLVVKASASRAGDPGFESRLRRDFFGVESYQ